MDNVYIIRNFIAAILHETVYDWFKHPRRREEIRAFFNSRWGKECCDVLNLSANDILNKLENGKIYKRYLTQGVE